MICYMRNPKDLSTSTEPASRLIEINGVQLNLLDWGGSGEPILILHATGFLGRIYGPIAERLRTIGHVYSYDQRGQGDSKKAADNAYNWYYTLSDLEGLITAMGWSNIRAIGHSAGATAIGSLASERPDLISQAVLIDPVIFDNQTRWNDNPMRDRAFKRRSHFESVESMFEDFICKPPFNTWKPEVLHDYCEFGTRPAKEGGRELKCSPEVEATMYDTAYLFHGLERILKCKRPLLFLFAGKNGPFTKYASDISAKMENAQVIVAPGLSHLMAMEDPDFVAEKAMEFFTLSL